MNKFAVETIGNFVSLGTINLIVLKINTLQKIYASILLIVMIVGFNYSGEAQVSFSYGGEIALPLGEFNDSANTGLGMTIRYEGNFSGHFAVIGDIGYFLFTTASNKKFYSMIPIQAGGKYYYNKGGSGVYGMTQIGTHITKVLQVDVDNESNTLFSFAPSVGFALRKMDIALRYQMVFGNRNVPTRAFLGIRGVLNF
ncbi:MAG: hypothetical protein ABEH43_04465 [Flavobacteriales bacterium]